MARRTDSNTFRDSFLMTFGVFGAAGMQLAAAVVLGVFGGYWLDGHWGTSPLFLIIGLLLGGGGGFYNLLRLLKWNERRLERKSHFKT